MDITESKWLPITTAPKDGTPIILANNLCLNCSTAEGWWVERYQEWAIPSLSQLGTIYAEWATHWTPINK